MLTFPAGIWSHRHLIRRLVAREIEARFRGSFLGLFWAIIVPLVMLCVFSLVFGTIFQSRWAQPESASGAAPFSFPMILFIGLIVYGLLAEPLNRAPGLVMENVTYVKKVVFPLEVLPVVALISALVTALVSFAAFLAVFVALYGLPPATILLLPVALLPLVLFVLGCAYVLASLGVFLRDLKQVVPLLTTAMLFLSSVFYAPENVPEQYRWLLFLNPVTPAVTYARDIVFWGRLPDPMGWTVTLLLSLVVASAGAYWFMRTEKAFADVV